MAPKYSRLRKESSRESDGFSDAGTDNVPMAKLSWKCLTSSSIMLACLSIFTITMLVSWIMLRKGSEVRRLPTPSLPTETVAFQKFTEFESPPTPENTALWMDLLGPGMGFVTVQNPGQYGLSGGISDDRTPPDTEIFGISMYHQLHCLLMIRNSYWAALRGEKNPHFMGGRNEELRGTFTHVNHCFDYIRQGIMCAGDMSLEGAAALTSNKDDEHINGYGSHHECKSYEASRKWMDANVPP